MKAAVYYETGAPDVFRYEDVPDPVCGPGMVLIEVRAVSIECGGVIRQVGDGTRDRAVGQTVVAVMPHGSHAELVAVPAGTTWAVPDGLDVRAAACVPIPFGTADDCLFEFGRLRAGETALIQ